MPPRRRELYEILARQDVKPPAAGVQQPDAAPEEAGTPSPPEPRPAPPVPGTGPDHRLRYSLLYLVSVVLAFFIGVSVAGPGDGGAVPVDDNRSLDRVRPEGADPIGDRTVTTEGGDTVRSGGTEGPTGPYVLRVFSASPRNAEAARRLRDELIQAGVKPAWLHRVGDYVVVDVGSFDSPDDPAAAELRRRVEAAPFRIADSQVTRIEPR